VYTQCPECGTVFRITAVVLRAAQGQVRCGVCDANFDALRFLSDDPDPDSESHADHDPAEFTAAGEAAAEPPAGHADDAADVGAPREPWREEPGPQWATHATDAATREHLPTETSVAAAAGASAATERGGAADSHPAFAPMATAGAAPAVAVERTLDAAETVAVVAAAALAAMSERPAAAEPEEPAPAPIAEPLASAAAEPAPPDPPDPSDLPLAADAASDQPSVDTDVEPDVEPDFEPRFELDADPEADAEPEPALPWAAQAAALEAPADPVITAEADGFLGDAPPPAAKPRPLAKVAAAALLLVLAGQLVHHFRETLAANELAGPAVSALYQRLGQPIEPHWDLAAYDVRQWGAASDQVPGALRLRASIVNRATRAQPCPLLRVTLLDRFGGHVARREFTPAEYLPSHPAGAAPIAAGARADAELSVADPGSQAVGFELDVCLRRGTQLACGVDQKQTGTD
jgi:predicted Zn finger-like uncharacterized protein